ncbi:HAD-like domain [Trichophyton rubrum]|nr:HAD-like domain [Trichophyton rubrum]
MEESSATRDSRPVFFFDIDNCVHSKIHDLMQELIDKFFVKHLSLDVEDAVMLHHRYYKEYGLAIEGLTRFHKIDPLVFNREVDDALPLDDILKPNMKLRTLLEDFDKTKVKLWLLTNAYVTHGKRVVKLLGVDDLFEGITYCDYSAEKLVCKPDREMYLKAEREAGAASPEECYFVDDSHLNCRHAQAHNWTTIHFVEPTLPAPETRASKYQIADLEEIRALFPQFFKAPN